MRAISLTLIAIATFALRGAPAAATPATASSTNAGAISPVSSAGPVAAADGHVQVSLVTDVDSAIPGAPFWVGLRFQLVPGWHVYWKNHGQSGMPTEVEWSGDGVTLGPTRWPAPERITSSDGFIVTYGWHGDVVLLSEARTTAGGTIRASATFLVCEVECIPGSVELSRHIEAGHGGPGASDVRAVMASSWARVPRPAAEHGLTLDVQHAPSPVPRGASFSTTIRVSGDGVGLPARGPEHTFFPERVETVTHAPAIRVATGGPGTGVIVDGSTSPDDPGGDQRFAGVLALERNGAPLFVEVASPLPRARDVAPAAAPAGQSPEAAQPVQAPAIGLLELLALAFLGGLLLNLMPCVLPVLAIKVGGLVRLAGERTLDRARHAGAYAAGIVGSLLLLAAVVLALRTAGNQVGWGFQFQEPGFLVSVGALLVVLAVNAFGGLEIGIGADALTRAVDARHGLARSAGEGVLAVVLATPCSAPFLGSAIGVALASPPHVVAVAFLTVGLGLATPVALLAVVPGARRVLPRPGAWMVRLKQAVGFALLAAAVWLAWILGRGFGVDATAGALAFWVSIGVGAWIVGATFDSRPRRRVVAAVLALALVIVTGALTLRFDPAAAANERTGRLGAGWEAWSEAAVAKHLAAGRAVFVDFTADWCLTCKVNERTVLASDEVRRTAEARGVAMLKADWTLPDPAISAMLRRFRKAGVPMYLVYSPARPDAPEVLPELLTPSIVVTALEAAAPPS